MSGKRYNPKDFEVKEVNEDDFRFSIIERSNMKNEFTLADIEAAQAEMHRLQKEITSQMNLCKATCDNITSNHPFIEDLSLEQTHHVWMYEENRVVAEDSEAKLKEVEEQLDEYEKLSDVIYKVGGFVRSDKAVTIDQDELQG